ncbi:MAG: Zn-ribbon domain-containing OB-fold protein [Caulobacterales bacterium]
MTDVQDRTAPTTRRVPAPAQNLESKPFWDAAKEGRFLIKRCNACGEPHWYPRNICPYCMSSDTVWQESPGEGVIYTYSVMHRNTPVPYAIGYVTLNEGVSLLTNFVDCDFAALKIGQKVKIKWTPTSEGNPPVFTFTPA